jgi:hypothetical protein
MRIDMKKIAIIILSLFSLTSYCQDKDRKFAIGVCFSPDYCFRTYSADDSLKWVIDVMDSMEIPKFGYTTGLNFNYKISPRLDIDFGFKYSIKGYKTHWLKMIAAQPNDPLIPDKILYVYNYIYFDFPLKLNYLLLDKNLKLFVSGGVSTNIFQKEIFITSKKYNDGSVKTDSVIDKSDYHQNVNFAALAGLVLDYNISDRLKLRLEPTFRYSINSVFDSPIKGYLYSIGLDFGIYIKI